MARCCVRLSVVCNVCIVAKRYVLRTNCLKKQIGLPDRYPAVPTGTPYDSQTSKRGYSTVPPPPIDSWAACVPFMRCQLQITTKRTLVQNSANATSIFFRCVRQVAALYRISYQSIRRRLPPLCPFLYDFSISTLRKLFITNTSGFQFRQYHIHSCNRHLDYTRIYQC